MLPRQVDVVVVGGGPTGLVLTATLQQAGHTVLGVDRQEEGANTSRAAAIHAHTLQALNELDVTEALIDEGVVVPVFTVRDRDRILAQLEFGSLPTPYPFVLTLPQDRTEAILTERLRRLGGAIQRPYRVTGVFVEPDGAVVGVDGPGGAQAVRARYVVGADGSHSVVRESLGINFSGGNYAQAFLLGDVRVDWPLRRDEVQNFFSPDGIVVSAPLPDDQRRVVATVDKPPRTITAEYIQEILDTRGPAGAHVRTLEWSSQFRVQHRIADTFRAGPVFLAGDAAHVHSPAGGQGMNLGIQDALDLGHTLAASLDGVEAIDLDGYERRRRPIAKATVRFTDIMTRASIITNRPGRRLRNAALTALGHLPPARRQMAKYMAQLA